MQAFVSEKSLVEGVWFAMEQAGRLLHTAVQVFNSGDSSTSIALAMFAREELGRSRILLDLAYEVHCGGGCKNFCVNGPPVFEQRSVAVHPAR
jgi:hypothetical protein